MGDGVEALIVGHCFEQSEVAPLVELYIETYRCRELDAERLPSSRRFHNKTHLVRLSSEVSRDTSQTGARHARTDATRLE